MLSIPSNIDWNASKQSEMCIHFNVGTFYGVHQRDVFDPLDRVVFNDKYVYLDTVVPLDKVVIEMKAQNCLTLQKKRNVNGNNFFNILNFYLDIRFFVGTTRILYTSKRRRARFPLLKVKNAKCCVTCGTKNMQKYSRIFFAQFDNTVGTSSLNHVNIER